MEEIHYELMDDNGSNAMYLPILLEAGTVFKHEFGTYKVDWIQKDSLGKLVVVCERIE